MSDSTAVPDNDAEPHASLTIDEHGNLDGDLLIPLRPRRHTAPASVRPPTTPQANPGSRQSETDPAARATTPRGTADPRRPGPEDTTPPASRTTPDATPKATPGPGPGPAATPANPLDTAIKDGRNAADHAQKTVNNAVKGTPLDPANLQNLGQSLANSPLATTLPLSLLQAGLSTLTSISGMMAALVMAQAQFGQGNPSQDNSTYPGPALNNNLNANTQNNWDGAGQKGYLTTNDDKKRKTDAIGQLDQGLKKLLKDSGENTRLGRAKIQQILDTVNQQLTTLSPISNTAAGQAQIMNILTQAITQAGGVIAQAQGQSGINAAGLRNLANQYVTTAAATPTPTDLRVPNGGNLKANTPREKVAAKIIAEGRRRGFTDAQIIPLLAGGIQESNLDQQAQGGGGKWHGVYQQDASYAGRDDLDQNIAGMYDRLAAKRNSPGWSDNMYLNFFWLQQAPAYDSADAAYANGRQGYLTEIQGRHAEATQLFNQVTAT